MRPVQESGTGEFIHTVSAEPSHDPETRWTGLIEIGLMAGPIILGTLSYTLMQFVDAAMVSRLGDEALAAIGSSGLWSYVLSTLIAGIVGCVSTFVSQGLGRGERANCAKYAWQGIWMSIPAAVLGLALIPAARPLFDSMNHSEAVTAYEITYFRVRVLGYLFLAWSIALVSFYQAIGRPLVPMLVGVCANVLNAILDYVLIFGEWGL